MIMIPPGIVIFGSLMYMAEGGEELNAFGYGGQWRAPRATCYNYYYDYYAIIIMIIIIVYTIKHIIVIYYYYILYII